MLAGRLAERLLEEKQAPITALWKPGVQDIAVQRPGEAWVLEDEWHREKVPLELEDLQDIGKYAAGLRGHDLDARFPICDPELPGRLRLNVCRPPVLKNTMSLVWRQPEAKVFPTSDIASRYDTEDWHRWELVQGGRNYDRVMDAYEHGDVQAFIDAAVYGRLNQLLVGPVGSGKTTLAKTICSAFGVGERIVTIEDTEELELRQPNIVRLFTSPVAGQACLIKTSLRMRADRVLLGEMREPDAAWVFVDETQLPGILSTIHAHDAPSGLLRLFGLLRGAKECAGMSDSAVIAKIAAAVDVVIPLNTSLDGKVKKMGRVWFEPNPKKRKAALSEFLL